MKIVLKTTNQTYRLGRYQREHCLIHWLTKVEPCSRLEQLTTEKHK